MFILDGKEKSIFIFSAILYFVIFFNVFYIQIYFVFVNSEVIKSENMKKYIILFIFVFNENIDIFKKQFARRLFRIVDGVHLSHSYCLNKLIIFLLYSYFVYKFKF
jgi:hypothetical protein